MSRHFGVSNPAVLAVAQASNLVGPGAGPGAAWTPADLTGLVGWWRSDQGITVADTDKVEGWADLSPAGNDLLGSVGGTDRPVYDAAGGIDSYPSLEFDGTNDQLVAAFALEQPATVLIVARLNTWALNDVIFDGFTANYMLLQCITGSPTVRISSSGSLSGGDSDPGNWIAVKAAFNAASSALRIGNDAELTGNAGVLRSTGGFRLGRRSSGNAAHISVVEAAVLDQVIDPAEEVLHRAYLQTRYPSLGLT